ncbi:MAG: helix-turn-helix domain-containing protein [Candidatus Gracilibacteria bacterium]|nr:helix-turn-helix domain-containing protein [Candidatus Gracilibacteria bacterium]
MKIIEKNIKKKSNKGYISFEERLMIEKMLNQKMKQSKIAKVLSRGKSTINDEIKRYSTYASWYEAHLAYKKLRLSRNFL